MFNNLLQQAKNRLFATSDPYKTSFLGKKLGAQPIKEKPIPLPREVKVQKAPIKTQEFIPKIAPEIISPLATAAKRVTKVPKVMATEPYEQNITIPGSQGGTTKIPGSTAQTLMNNFNDIGEATNAAMVLHHPRSQTYTPEEIKTYGRKSINHGENASFRNIVDATQSDGSIDRGLMRINSNTFNGLMQRHPEWMAKAGITSWEQMNDPELNARVARLILLDSNYKDGQVRSNPSWRRWFAAPLELRKR